MQDENGVFSGVKDFQFSAVSCGLKRTDALDLALIYSKRPATVAGVFTKNRIQAAPVLVCRERLPLGRARAIVANAGCANACTGAEGYENALQTARWVAQSLGVAEQEVFVASTGVIGEPLPVDRIGKKVRALKAGLRDEGLPEVARAIMTTDTRPKWTQRSGTIGGVPYRMAAVTKGAGMIHPDMATMLCFVLSDAPVSSPLLQELLEKALEESFHAVTVDGDTSTNDTVLVLANGACGSSELTGHSEDSDAFGLMLEDVLREMALSLVQDAEGATKLIHIEVMGAHDVASADKVARTIAHSPLVKTDFYGQDVNWGRVLAAVGYSGVEVDPGSIDLYYDRVQVVRKGRGLGGQAEARAKAVAKKREFVLRVSLGAGGGRRVIHTCDLSHDYVSINASYKT